MPTETWPTFSTLWDEGYRRVLTLRAIGVSSPRSGVRVVLRWIAISTAPPAIALVTIGLDRSVPDETRVGTMIFLATLAVFNSGIFASAAFAWNYVRLRSASIDHFFAESPDWRRATLPIERAYSLGLQLKISLAVAALPPVAMVILDRPKGPGYWTATLAGSFTSFFLANVLLSLVVCPLLILRLGRVTGLRWRWNDPARTPAIRTLASAYGYAAIFVGLAALGVTLPGLFGSPLLSRALPISYALLLVLALYVGAVTQWSAARTVRRVRLQMLDRLVSNSVLESSDSGPAVEEIWAHGNGVESETLEAYSQIAAGRNLPYTSTTVVEYFVVVIGGLASFALQTFR